MTFTPWRPAEGERYQHVVLLEHGYCRTWLDFISRFGRPAIEEAVATLAARHDKGTGKIEAAPATHWAGHGDWARVGDYLLFWHAGWNYVCLERVITR